MKLYNALLAADNASNPNDRAAMRVMRAALASSYRISVSDLLEVARLDDKASKEVFPVPLTGEQRLFIAREFVHNRKFTAQIGACSIYWDNAAEVIWGTDAAGVESTVALGNNAAAIFRAIDWAVQRNSPPQAIDIEVADDVRSSFESCR